MCTVATVVALGRVRGDPWKRPQLAGRGAPDTPCFCRLVRVSVCLLVAVVLTAR